MEKASMEKPNPKLAGSRILDCIPQTGRCPNGCLDCYYNHGFYRSLNTPLMPTIAETEGKLVRVNTGHDSNIGRETVIAATAQYRHKFYNTAIPSFDFPAPVVWTCNGRGQDDTFNPHDLSPEPDLSNVMVVRVRTNTWNSDVVARIVDYFTRRRVPILLTFMRYRNLDSLKRPEDYEHRVNILNSYWCIRETPWREIVRMFEHDPLVFTCGRFWGNSHCSNCGNCELLHARHRGMSP